MNKNIYFSIYLPKRVILVFENNIIQKTAFICYLENRFYLLIAR